MKSTVLFFALFIGITAGLIVSWNKSLEQLKIDTDKRIEALKPVAEYVTPTSTYKMNTPTSTLKVKKKYRWKRY